MPAKHAKAWVSSVYGPYHAKPAYRKTYFLHQPVSPASKPRHFTRFPEMGHQDCCYRPNMMAWKQRH
ncbi:hypothetical protein PENSUB_10326 [Penicillium subrubescens]|uniref:Uncharacterized protein n=1 Tax=Penicillium subrubescens TaxID=1316194 RepID=A0A1Q5TBC3_9EURO|nr:hypothetical protein PENSUB_10326 [Penicillium subrubescens]